METDELTIRLPRDILERAKRYAKEHDTTLTRLVSEHLHKLVQQEDACARAQERHPQWLEQGADLGTEGQIPIRRDELHERT